MWKTILFSTSMLALCYITAVLAAQTPAGQSFDVASVKLNKSGDARTGGQLSGGRFSMINETLWRLVGEAYADPQALPRLRIIGGPRWIDTDRFDIQGVAEGALTKGQAQLMLRALLAERFKLVVHAETRELPVYALALARTDGKLGPALRQSKTDCAAGRLENGLQKSQAANQAVSCVIEFGFGRLAANGMTVKELAAAGLSRYAGRSVMDKTGLSGPFDWTLVWTPDNLPPRGPGTPADQPLMVNGFAVDPNGPPLFTALEEQLGLRLEATKGPVEVLVIDHAETPSEN